MMKNIIQTHENICTIIFMIFVKNKFLPLMHIIEVNLN